MWEYLVKSLIKTYLGDFIETDLNVSVSMYSGKADLNNVQIKKDIF